MATASEVMKIAAGQIGYCRFDDPATGTKFGRWAAKVLGDPSLAANDVAYCDMFVSWVLDQAGQPFPGTPGSYVPSTLAAARKAGLVLSSKRDARFGDVIFFDWNGNGVPDHIGFVEIPTSIYCQCAEGNTTGADGRSGSVARRTRAWSTVLAVARPAYDSKPSKPAGGLWQIDEDGIWGEDTTALAQAIEGIKVSGKVYNQPVDNKSCFVGDQCWSFRFTASPKDGGSLLVRRIQNDLGWKWKDCDGYFGPDTSRRFIEKWVSDPKDTHKLGYPSGAVRNYQRWLNERAKALNIKRVNY